MSAIESTIEKQEAPAKGELAGVPGSPVVDVSVHCRHHIYLDRWKQRSVFISAPTVVSTAELQRIKSWLETVFIIEEPGQ